MKITHTVSYQSFSHCQQLFFLSNTVYCILYCMLSNTVYHLYFFFLNSFWILQSYWISHLVLHAVCNSFNTHKSCIPIFAYSTHHNCLLNLPTCQPYRTPEGNIYNPCASRKTHVSYHTCFIPVLWEPLKLFLSSDKLHFLKLFSHIKSSAFDILKLHSRNKNMRRHHKPSKRHRCQSRYDLPHPWQFLLEEKCFMAQTHQPTVTHAASIKRDFPIHVLNISSSHSCAVLYVCPFTY